MPGPLTANLLELANEIKVRVTLLSQNETQILRETLRQTYILPQKPFESCWAGDPWGYLEGLLASDSLHLMFPPDFDDGIILLEQATDLIPLLEPTIVHNWAVAPQNLAYLLSYNSNECFSGYGEATAWVRWLKRELNPPRNTKKT